MKDELAGTTANVVLLKGNRIFCVSCKVKNTGIKQIYFFFFFFFIFSIAKEITGIDILVYLNFSK